MLQSITPFNMQSKLGAWIEACHEHERRRTRRKPFHSPCPPLLSDSEDDDGPISRRAWRAAIQAGSSHFPYIVQDDAFLDALHSSRPPMDLLHLPTHRQLGVTPSHQRIIDAAALSVLIHGEEHESTPSVSIENHAVHVIHSSCSENDEDLSSDSLSEWSISENDDVIPTSHQRVETQQRGSHANHDIQWTS